MAKVLLVEDDNNLREIYQARLTAEGYDIVAAQNGEEALVVAKQNKPDLIISDVMMPRISGFEMLDILRNTEQLKHTKVIMLTALGQAEDQKRADTLGADKYLVKSQVTLEDIVNAAKELLGEVDGSSAVTAVPPAPEPVQTAPAAPTTAPEPSPVVASAPVEPAAQTQPVAVAPTVGTPVGSTPTPVVPTSTESTTASPVIVAPTIVTPTVPQVSAPVEPAASMPAAAAVPTSTEPNVVTPPTTDMPVVEEPVQTEQVQPTVAMPTPVEPAAQVPSPTAVTDSAQTLEDEEAALQAQISSYAQAVAEPALAVEPTPDTAATVESVPGAPEPNVVTPPTTDMPVVEEPVQTEQVQPTNNEAVNDAAIAQAVQTLNSPQVTAPVQPPSVANAPTPVAEPALAVEPTPVSPEPVQTAPADPVIIPTPVPLPNGGIAGKKVIQPITDAVAKPSLDELLAKEASMAAPDAGTPVVNGVSGSENASTPPAAHAPGDSFDPNVAL
jgi:CheY-like chemotaxis protein